MYPTVKLLGVAGVDGVVGVVVGVGLVGDAGALSSPPLQPAASSDAAASPQKAARRTSVKTLL
jgi:hypothetical protein